MADAPPEPPRLFGFWAGAFTVVASMVGTGILTTSGPILVDVPSAWALLGLWALGGVLALCGALCVAEMATAMPKTGGDYLFARVAFGPTTGFVCGWATFVLAFCAPTAVAALSAVEYLAAPWLNPEALAWAKPAGATLLVAAVAALHCLGHRESAGAQIAVTVVTVLCLGGVAVAGLLSGGGDWGHFAESQPLRDWNWSRLAVGLVLVGYAYAGWNGAGYLAGELRDPVRLLPRCLLAGTAAVTALYLLVNVMYAYALSPADLKTMGEDRASRIGEAALVRLFGASVGGGLASGLGLMLVAAVSAFLLTGARVGYAMGADGVFPRAAGRLHPTRGVPTVATLAQAGAAILLIWLGSFRQLLDYASVGLAAVSCLVVAGVFAFRRRADLPAAYRMPLYPLPPLLYLGFVLWTIAATLLEPTQRGPALWSLATLAAGVPLARLVRAV